MGGLLIIMGGYTSMVSHIVRRLNPEDCDEKSDITIPVGNGSKKGGKGKEEGKRRKESSETKDLSLLSSKSQIYSVEA